LDQRRKAVTEKAGTLKRELSGPWSVTELYSMDINNIFDSFGYPSFSYQVPVMPVQKTNELNPYRQTTSNAVRVTLQTLEKHWDIYCEAVMKWWVKAFAEEATVTGENVNKLLQELENRKKEIEFQAIQVNCQKNTIRGIRSRAESIRHQLQD
jgi:hypothetical protein